MGNDSLYPTAFASPRRDSFTPVAASAKGMVSWTHDLALKETGGPLHLLLLDRTVIVTQVHGLVAFSPEGQRLWEAETMPGSPVAVANGRVYYANKGLALDALDATGKKVLASEPLPGLASREFVLLLLWPRATDMVLGIDHPDPRYNMEDRDAVIEPPTIEAGVATYGLRTSAWSAAFVGVVTLPPPFVPEKNRWLVGQTKVASIDVTTEQDTDAAVRFSMPMAKPTGWSAGADGVLVMLGLDDKQRKDVVGLDLEGRERWHWVDREGTDAWVVAQPPIHGPKGRVLLLTSQRVLALEAGKLVWAFDAIETAKAERAKDKTVELEGPAYGTALADGSLLLAAGRTLRQLDADGKVRFALRLPAAIVGPPVVDAAGAIYVATATQLIQIK